MAVGSPLPFGAPWYRVVVVAVALIGVTILLPTSSDIITPDGVTPGPGTAIILAVLLVPSVIGYELFSRGALYSLIDARWGAGAAVLRSTVSEIILLLPGSGALTAASALVLALFFGLSRAALPARATPGRSNPARPRARRGGPRPARSAADTAWPPT